MMLRKQLNDTQALPNNAYWSLGVAACEELENLINAKKIETTKEDKEAFQKAINLLREQLMLGRNSDDKELSKNGIADKKKYSEQSEAMTKIAYPETGMPVIKGILTLLFVEQVQSPFLRTSQRYVPNTDNMYSITAKTFGLFASAKLKEKVAKADKLDVLTATYRAQYPEISAKANSVITPVAPACAV